MDQPDPQAVDIDNMPFLHLGIVVPPDAAAAHRVIGWDDEADANPIIVGAIGAEAVQVSPPIPTPDGSALHVMSDLAATLRPLARNDRALVIAQHLGAPWTAVGGTVVLIGPVGSRRTAGLTHRQYAWLDEALTQLTRAYRAAHHLLDADPPDHE